MLGVVARGAGHPRGKNYTNMIFNISIFFQYFSRMIGWVADTYLQCSLNKEMQSFILFIIILKLALTSILDLTIKTTG